MSSIIHYIHHWKKNYLKKLSLVIMDILKIQYGSISKFFWYALAKGLPNYFSFLEHNLDLYSWYIGIFLNPLHIILFWFHTWFHFLIILHCLANWI